MRYCGSLIFTIGLLAVTVGLAGWASGADTALPFPGSDPGAATARLENGRLVMENGVLRARWDIAAGRLRLVEVVDRASEGRVAAGPGEAFIITLADGTEVRASELRPAAEPSLQRIEPEPAGLKRSFRRGGWQANVPLVSQDGRLSVGWSARLRDGANYITQEFALRAGGQEVSVRDVVLLEVDAPKAEVIGVVEGSPIVAETLFFACEHPMADNRVENGRVLCRAQVHGPLRPGEAWRRTSVIGVAPRGQLRRAFLYYVENERARPYGPFLHYNSWWDIAWGDRRMNERQCLDVIETFGRELTEKRGVRMDSFCFDDGWDDARTLWGFHDGFPQGFTPLRSAAAKYGSHVGTWFSPWGGYGPRKQQRLEFGKRAGFETNAKGFSMAGPKYYARYREICAEMIDKYGVNYFKFDGIARGGASDGAGDEFAADIEGLLRLTQELREMEPEVYLSITTGTWPSPYWLWYGDSVWRSGHDWGFHGAGSMRQQGITYRDMLTYRMIVRRAPLYPINSLMVVNVCFGQVGTTTRMSDDVDDLVDEIRMGFGCGTQLLELYLTPQKMKPQAWDALAEAAQWTRANADVLVDVHWIGGDPGQGEPYGYASWSPRKGILVLRNPSDAPAEMTLELAAAFELPDGAPEAYCLASHWPTAGRIAPLTLSARQPHTFELAPFEVVMVEALPAE